MESPSSLDNQSPPTTSENVKTTITCSNVPESLLDPAAAKKHFSKFGKVQRIHLSKKKQCCTVLYEQPSSVERALLNAGAFDGFMFDVTRAKPRPRRKSKKESDPDWIPDPDVELELSAMQGGPSYVTRQNRMDTSSEIITPKTPVRAVKQSPIRKKLPLHEKPVIPTQKSGIESPVVVTTTQTTMSTSEAAAELNQLRHKVSLTPDEQWRILDARDRILRAWGGAGARVRVGGATIGTCPDMCPEKERLHRQAEHQVMSLETVPDCDYKLEPRRAVKQYSRSSADQEIPMCYELRPAAVLGRTGAYLLSEVADTARPVTLADWFHFMWDRFRGIRKDITQQALCCAESIRLVEMCARFHAHCAARLADLEHAQFDQKLNTDNLTKCLQTLKHMYADAGADQKPREAEFRGYIALLNLGDANFWWEIKNLPQVIQKSEEITFAVKVFNALDNNNYVRFFRLVREEATYLQACILLRYFNDVRARALARIVKAFAPRGASRYPAEELMKVLAFETKENMKSFVTHYGLRFGKTDDTELTVILDRNQFIEDSDPYPVARALQLIESKRHSKVGAVIAGGQVPVIDFGRNLPYSSFNKDGTLKEEALTAQDQGFNTANDSNKNLQGLRDEIKRLAQGGRSYTVIDKPAETKESVFAKVEVKSVGPGIFSSSVPRPNEATSGSRPLFSFQPAIPVAPIEVINESPVKVESPSKEVFVFSKPQETKDKLFSISTEVNKHVFGKPKDDSNNIFTNKSVVFTEPKSDQNVFKSDVRNSTFIKSISKNLFASYSTKNIFSNKDETDTVFSNKNIFASSKGIFDKPDATSKSETGSIFGKQLARSDNTNAPSNVFGSFNKDKTGSTSIFAANENTHAISPGSLFKNAIKTDSQEEKPYSIFQSKNNIPSVAQNIFNSNNNTPKNGEVYEFNDDEHNQFDNQQQLEQKLKEQQMEEMRRMEEIRKKEEERKQEIKRQEEKKRQEEQKRKQQELVARMEEERRREEIRKKEELKKRLEEEKNKRVEEAARVAELKRKAEEERLFKIRVDKESGTLTEELTDEITEESVKNLMKYELDKLNHLMTFAGKVTDDILTELCSEICDAEMLAEKIWTDKLLNKWFYIWRRNFIRNVKRRELLEDTPIWLTGRTPTQEASYLKRLVENAALKNMNAIHRGYKFVGQLPHIPDPAVLNLMEIIKSPLLKRMKQINYRYDKGLFWKVTLVSPASQWLCRKVNLENWMLKSFSDKKEHEVSGSLIHVGKHNWNQLIDFVISVSIRSQNNDNCSEAMEGTNGLLFYTTENDSNLIETIQDTLRSRYTYQVVPITIITPESQNERLEQYLVDCVNTRSISAFKIFTVDSENIFDSIKTCTKSSLKWLARNCPEVPPLEIDYLKSICERYLGNEIWFQLRKSKDSRFDTVMKDLYKLVHCYNVGVDKLTEVITNEDLFNYPLFPIEFKEYLNNGSLYPKPYEYVPSNIRSSENIAMIKNMMNQLKLCYPVGNYLPVSADNMQQQINTYCNQIGWFQYPQKSTREVTMFELSDILRMPHEHFKMYFENFDLASFLNLIIYEKINSLRDFDNRFAVYKKSVIEDYCNALWLHEVDVVCNLKHKAIENEDELDEFINAKRRKIALDSLEYLILEEKDCTLVNESIREADTNITKYTDCKKEVNKLEEQIEAERQKSMHLENLLRAALQDL